jgi:hypothetical protein
MLYCPPLSIPSQGTKNGKKDVWLVNEVEECSAAIALGGNRFKDKWQTPDDPDFTIQTRPVRSLPDMFYTNKYMKLIEKELF